MASPKALSYENLQTAMIENNTKMKQWVISQINKNDTFNMEWVESLPTSNISTNTIYMLKDNETATENNIYIEYVYNKTTGWEILGSIDAGSIDLTNYYKKEEIDKMFEETEYTDEEIESAITETINLLKE